MVQRVRDIHGRFVTPDEKAAQEAEIAARWHWEAPEVLREYDNGLRLVSLRDYRDLAKWGKNQSHCGGTHYKWVGEQQIWHFLTFLDKNNRCHGSVHLKDKEWFKKPHPEDTVKRAVVAGAGTFTPAVPDGLWCKSTDYESYTNYKSFANDYHNKSYKLFDKEVVVLSAYARGGANYGEEYNTKLKEFFAEHEVNA